jgi:DNA-binding NarL/FixJ family response regulator
MPPLTEARQPSKFNINNFLDYRAYEPPFNPQVHHLEVLVATDQPGFAAYLSAEQNSRVHITAVSSGNEAISQLMAYPDKYHVVLTDMHMENGNGIDVAKYVHEHHLPCYVTVVSKSSVNPRDLFQYGVDGAMSVMSSPNGESFRPASTILAYLSNMVFNKGNVFGLPKKD